LINKGNAFNIIIFGKKELRKFSTFRYLLYLSVFDLLVLIFCATDAFLRFGYQIQIRQYSQYLCRFHTFFTYFLTHVSSCILMIVSVDRALVVNNKSLYFDILRLRKFEKIEKKEAHSYFCGVSLCCLLHCGLSSNVIRRVNHKSFMHRIDLIIIGLLIIVALLNIHYLFLMNINIIEFKDHMYNYSFIQDNMSISGIRNFNFELKRIESPPTNVFCYPLEGK